jgi:hypothetical protein
MLQFSFFHYSHAFVGVPAPFRARKIVFGVYYLIFAIRANLLYVGFEKFDRLPAIGA